MKVVHINKSDAGGGAAVAAMRIHRALMRDGVDSHLLVHGNRRNEVNEHNVADGKLGKLGAFGRFVGERIALLPYIKELSLQYYFSIANTGFSLAHMPIVRDADIIHLHWINQGYLSFDGLSELFELGKPIVWTLHDMWPFTGGCHYAGNCLEFNERCGYCPFMSKPGKDDLSTKIYFKKKELYAKAPLNIVTCSRWLGTLAKSSSLFRNKQVDVIPNPIDTNFYVPMDRKKCREDLGLPTDKKLILFGAANMLDVRKGFRYLEEALAILRDNFPGLCTHIELVVFGNMKHSVQKLFTFNTHVMKFVSDPHMLVKLYNAADTFILPSIQDNLPNTVVESLCCGTPVVGFRIGGVPEMIEHNKSGFLAEVKNSLSLANGIYNMLFFGDDTYRANARNSALEKFSEHVVAQKYIEVYRKALAGINV